jgi:hypothetical protein
LNNASVVSPGTSPGVLTVNGNFAQTASGTLSLELNGPTAGTEYDRLAVAGTVTLAGQIAATLGFTPTPGQSFVVIDNAGTDAVVGTFTGLAEGATLPASGHSLRINYAGGDGNDVTLTVLAPPAPAVTDVFVSGSTWSPGFLNFLLTTGVGDGTYGYRIPAADQLNELPWTNLDRVSIRFDGPVNLAAGDLVVRGVNLSTYALAATNGFTYDAATFTATWMLAAPVGADKLLLDLESPAAGLDFSYRLYVLPGDVNRSGGVLGSDVTLVRNAQNILPGSAGYTIFLDVNGSGSILGSDVTLVRNRQGFSLPTEEPVEP